MPSGKDRLYVALYARGGKPKMPTLEDTYHWALIIGPKNESVEGRGWRFHAKEGLKPDGTLGWLFEEKEIPLVATQMLLVRICVGKIEKNDRVKTILRGVPIHGGIENWNCVHWVKEAISLLEQDKGALGTSDLAWANIRNTAMKYVEEKKEQHRFDGKCSFDTSKAATFDLLKGTETIP